MAAWTLTYGETTKTFAAWGLKGLKRSEVSQAVGGVSFTQSGAAYDGTPLFDIDSVVTISKDGVKWHVGPVIMVPRSGGAKGEKLEYKIADPWWYLEQLNYYQYIATGTGALATQTTRIAMFADNSGGGTLKLSVATVIITAFAQAQAAGGSLTVAFEGNFGISPPIVDMRDPTCAEVIRAALRWVPDVTGGWDYSTPMPTLRLATRAGASVREIDLADAQTVNLISITARDDLRRDKVVLNFETTTTDDTDTYVTYQTDSAGSGSPFRTIRATLPLSGPQIARQEQYLLTEQVEEDNSSWWQDRVAVLTDAVDREITEGEISPSDEDGNGDVLDMEIVEGQVPGWLDDADNPITGTMVVSALASYKLVKEDGSTITYKDDPVSVTLNCTSLGSGTYKQVTSYTDGELAPFGLAGALLAALSHLQYEGRIKIKQRECSFICRPGDVLNLLNGVAAWATALMQVQKVDEDIDGGETLISFGPSQHLSPQDVVEMLRTLRGKLPVHNLDERNTGIKDKGSGTTASTAGANANGSSGCANWYKLYVKDPEGTASLTLDAAEGVKLDNGEGGSIDHQTANLRSLYTDEGGNTCEIKPSQIELLDEEGNGITINAAGITITNGTDTTTLTLNQLLLSAGGNTNSITEEQMVLSDGTNTTVVAASSTSVSDGTGSSELSPAHLLLDGGAGNTNSITDEQMVLSGSGNIAIYGNDSISLTKSTGESMTLAGNNFAMLDGSYSSTITAEGGFATADSDADSQAKLSAAGGVHLDDGSSGIVSIVPIAEKDISLMDTDFCGGGGPAHAYVLRGEEEPVE